MDHALHIKKSIMFPSMAGEQCTFWKILAYYCLLLEIGLADISAEYLDFTDISILADFIGLSRCWKNAVTFHTHPDNLRKKAKWSKSRQLSYSMASRCGFINNLTKLAMKHTSAVASET